MYRGRGGGRTQQKVTNQAAKDRFLGRSLGGAVFGERLAPFMLCTVLMQSISYSFWVAIVLPSQELHQRPSENAPQAWCLVCLHQIGVGCSMLQKGEALQISLHIAAVLYADVSTQDGTNRVEEARQTGDS